MRRIHQRIASTWLRKQAVKISDRQRAKNRQVFNAMTVGDLLSVSEIAKRARMSERDTLVALGWLKKGGLVWEQHRMYERVK
jgi:hypothetical protein